jgi:hypothetical protein
MFDGDLESVSDFLNSAWSTGTGSVMTLYEPHLAERGNATAQEAADVHIRYVNSMEGNFQIGGPIMSQNATGTWDNAKKWYTVGFTMYSLGLKLEYSVQSAHFRTSMSLARRVALSTSYPSRCTELIP